MNSQKMKKTPKRKFRCFFVAIVCHVHCLSIVQMIYTVLAGYFVTLCEGVMAVLVAAAGLIG